MVFLKEFKGKEGFEIIKKSWEKFGKVGKFLRKVGDLFGKVVCRLKMILKNLANSV